MYSCLKDIKRENRLLLSQLTKHQASCSVIKQKHICAWLTWVVALRKIAKIFNKPDPQLLTTYDVAWLWGIGKHQLRWRAAITFQSVCFIKSIVARQDNLIASGCNDSS